MNEKREVGEIQSRKKEEIKGKCLGIVMNKEIKTSGQQQEVKWKTERKKEI